GGRVALEGAGPLHENDSPAARTKRARRKILRARFDRGNERPAAPSTGGIAMTTFPDRDHARNLLHQMLRIRRFEEKSAELYAKGKIRGFLHLYIGEEAVAVGAMQALTPEDAVVATYREHGHALARGMPMGPLMAELYGKANGCSRGRGGSMHFYDASRRFYGGYAIVGE